MITGDSKINSLYASNYSCPICHSNNNKCYYGNCVVKQVAWANTEDSAPKPTDESESKKRKRCKICGGSGYDQKGKPCRKC